MSVQLADGFPHTAKLTLLPSGSYKDDIRTGIYDTENFKWLASGRRVAKKHV